VATSATLHTSAGDIRVNLFADHAPKTVRNFVELATGTKDYLDPRTGQPGTGPYYDGTIAHRVIDGFMVQMGDPTGTGRGGPGYRWSPLPAPPGRFDARGRRPAWPGGGASCHWAGLGVTLLVRALSIRPHVRATPTLSVVWDLSTHSTGQPVAGRRR
jgi:hypothetical protein